MAKSSRTTHGQTKSRLYRIWAGMLNRCRNPNVKDYPRYGGRGIKVCPEWTDFTTFQTWALANGYADHLTLDRKENDRDYEPGNCRWTTHPEQQRNRRSNRLITAFGRTQCITDWSIETGISLSALWRRLDRGWSHEDAVSKPKGSTIKPDHYRIKRNNRHVTAYGQTMTVADWSAKTGTNYQTIWSRLKNNWSPEDAVGALP